MFRLPALAGRGSGRGALSTGAEFVEDPLTRPRSAPLRRGDLPPQAGRDQASRDVSVFRPRSLRGSWYHHMTITLALVQVLNGLQFGLILFLIAAGLPLVFGVMDFINLAHGVQYMVGAYFVAAFLATPGNFFPGLALALPAALIFGLVLELLVFRHLYDRDHLDQVLATFGVIIFLNQGVKLLWGAAPLSV